MTRNSQRPRSTRGKALIAMFAASAALAGGAQALAPAPAAAVMDDNNGDCADVTAVYWSAYCDDGSNGGGNGPTTGGSGGQPTAPVADEPEPPEQLLLDPTLDNDTAMYFYHRPPGAPYFDNAKERTAACLDLSEQISSESRDIASYRDQIDEEQASDDHEDSADYREHMRELFRGSRATRSVRRFNRKQYRAWDCDNALPNGDY